MCVPTSWEAVPQSLQSALYPSLPFQDALLLGPSLSLLHGKEVLSFLFLEKWDFRAEQSISYSWHGGC